MPNPPSPKQDVARDLFQGCIESIEQLRAIVNQSYYSDVDANGYADEEAQASNRALRRDKIAAATALLNTQVKIDENRLRAEHRQTSLARLQELIREFSAAQPARLSRSPNREEGLRAAVFDPPLR